MTSQIPTYQKIYGIPQVESHEFLRNLVAFQYQDVKDWKGTPYNTINKDRNYERFGQILAKNDICDLSIAGLGAKRAVENVFSMVVGGWEKSGKAMRCNDYTVYELDGDVLGLLDTYGRMPRSLEDTDSMTEQWQKLPFQVHINYADVLEGLKHKDERHAYNVVDLDFIGGFGGHTNAGKIDSISAALQNCLYLNGRSAVQINGSLKGTGNAEKAYRDLHLPRLITELKKNFKLVEQQLEKYQSGVAMMTYHLVLERK